MVNQRVGLYSRFETDGTFGAAGFLSDSEVNGANKQKNEVDLPAFPPFGCHLKWLCQYGTRLKMGRSSALHGHGRLPHRLRNLPGGNVVGLAPRPHGARRQSRRPGAEPAGQRSLSGSPRVPGPRNSCRRDEGRGDGAFAAVDMRAYAVLNAGNGVTPTR